MKIRVALTCLLVSVGTAWGQTAKSSKSYAEIKQEIIR
jgi:hypothetical protein